MRATRVYGLPARFLDNLLMGQVVLATWPDDIQRLSSLVAAGGAALIRPLNQHVLMHAELM